MKLPAQLKKNVLNELEFVIKKMKEEPDPARKIYFFSAVNGALERVIRFYFNRELLVAQAIMSLSYQTINDRINRIKMGDATVPFTEDLMNQLIASVSELRQSIEGNKTMYPALEKTIEVTFVASGWGFYTNSFLNYVETEQHSKEE